MGQGTQVLAALEELPGKILLVTKVVPTLVRHKTNIHQHLFGIKMTTWIYERPL